jgi:Tol biopolymer transport system component
MRRDLNGQEVKLADGYVFIIVRGDRVYYRNYFCQVVTMKTDGSHRRVLATRDMDFDMILVGHSIYLIDGASNTAILRMDTNGTNLQKVNNNRCNRFIGYTDNRLYYIRNNKLYKTNKETKNQLALYRMSLDGSQVTLTGDYDTVDICIDGDSIYYLISSMDEYQRDIYRSDLDGENLTQLHILPQDDGGPYRLAVKDGWIYYYIWYDGSELHRVRTDGTGDEVIFDGLVVDAELSGGWLFCYDDVTGYWWKVSLDGTEKEQLYPDTFGYQGPGI